MDGRSVASKVRSNDSQYVFDGAFLLRYSSAPGMLAVDYLKTGAGGALQHHKT